MTADSRIKTVHHVARSVTPVRECPWHKVTNTGGDIFWGNYLATLKQ